MIKRGASGMSMMIDSPIGNGLNNKVLLVGNFLSGANVNRSCPSAVCEQLASRLSDKGWDILTTSNCVNRFTRMIDMVATVWNQRHRYSVSQVDIFSGPSFYWAEAICWTLRKAGKPYILTLRGGNLPSFASRWPKRVRNLLRSAAAVSTPSRYLLEQLSSHRDDMHLIPNPLDLNACKFTLRKEPQARLIWLRSFHEIYNPMMAPMVLAKLSKDFPDIQLIMVGQDKGDGSFQKTQQVAAALGVTDRIVYPGKVSKAEVPEWLNKGDILLNTTNVDNTPVSVLEAMACGLCVVSTNVGGIPYLLKHDVDSLLVPPDSPDAMVSAVHRILAEKGLPERLSYNARKKAEKSDWSIVLPLWEALLNTLIERNKT
jgi:glycosyltransferase involved in cell wall biosynthesis